MQLLSYVYPCNAGMVVVFSGVDIACALDGLLVAGLVHIIEQA